MLKFIQADYAELKEKEALARKKFFRKKELDKCPQSTPQPIDAQINKKDTTATLKQKVKH